MGDMNISLGNLARIGFNARSPIASRSSDNPNNNSPFGSNVPSGSGLETIPVADLMSDIKSMLEDLNKTRQIDSEKGRFRRIALLCMIALAISSPFAAVFSPHQMVGLFSLKACVTLSLVGGILFTGVLMACHEWKKESDKSALIGGQLRFMRKAIEEKFPGYTGALKGHPEGPEKDSTGKLLAEYALVTDLAKRVFDGQELSQEVNEGDIKRALADESGSIAGVSLLRAISQGRERRKNAKGGT